MFLDLLIFIIQFSFISVPKLVLPEPDTPFNANDSCYTNQTQDYTTGKDAASLIVDFMTGQVSSRMIRDPMGLPLLREVP